jgi:hypothetical protein
VILSQPIERLIRRKLGIAAVNRRLEFLPLDLQRSGGFPVSTYKSKIMTTKISLQEIHEIRRSMTIILLAETSERWKYTRSNLYTLKGCAYFRVEIYSPNHNFRDLPASLCVNDAGKVTVHTPNGVTKKFTHQNLAETLSIVKAEMTNLKAELNNF